MALISAGWKGQSWKKNQNRGGGGATLFFGAEKEVKQAISI